MVGATAQISEAYLIPVRESMLEQFPFRILGFHSDNGSELIHHTVDGQLVGEGTVFPDAAHAASWGRAISGH